MNNEEALKIIQALADGVDPFTGEVLPKNSPYQSAQVVRALYASIKVLEHQTETDARRANLPVNAGKPWTVEEEQQVIRAFEEGKSVTEISNQHFRTYGAIQSRLIKLGKINVTDEPELNVELTPPETEAIQQKGTEIEASDKQANVHKCTDCGRAISETRLKALPGVSRCVTCQERLEKSDPKSVKRKVDEGLSGTREDQERMRTKQNSETWRRSLD